MTFEMKIAGTDELPKHLRILIAGAAGVGKTHLAATGFPDPLFVHCGSDLTTIAQIGNIPYVEANNEKEMFAVKSALNKTPEEREVLFGRPVNTLVVDSLDNFQVKIMKEHLAKIGKDEMDYKDWTWLAERMSAISLGLAQLPMDVVFICRTKEVEVGDRTVYKPGFIGAFSDLVFDSVEFGFLMTARTLTADENPEVEVDAEGTKVKIEVVEEKLVKRMLYASPLPYAEWVHTKFPTDSVIEIDDQPLSSKLVLPLYNGEIGESETHTIDPDKVEEEEDSTPESDDNQIAGQMTVDEVLELIEEENPDTNECSDCEAKVTSATWKDLSNIKFGKTLCGTCFKQQ